MKLPRPASLILRLGASASLALLWLACNGTTSPSGQGGAGTGGAECVGCQATCATDLDCSSHEICVSYCGGCTECVPADSCTQDAGCPG